jgi:redox-sensitive bicupin YhaK (pirin superfamily)
MDVRRGSERTSTVSDRIVSRHSFAFGPHYDPGNLGFGLLVVHNEDTIAPLGGYDLHPHRDMEIVTWVLAGALEHRDSEGHDGVLVPGVAQRMSAGSGVRHIERNASLEEGGTELHMVQMWIRPDAAGIPPSYAQADVSPALAGGGLVVVASGLTRHADSAAIRLGQVGAGLSIARIPRNGSIAIPTAPLVHVFVTSGAVSMETDGSALQLNAGDAVRLRDGQGERVLAAADAEIMVWELHG